MSTPSRVWKKNGGSPPPICKPPRLLLGASRPKPKPIRGMRLRSAYAHTHTTGSGRASRHQPRGPGTCYHRAGWKRILIMCRHVHARLPIALLTTWLVSRLNRGAGWAVALACCKASVFGCLLIMACFFLLPARLIRSPRLDLVLARTSGWTRLGHSQRCGW